MKVHIGPDEKFSIGLFARFEFLHSLQVVFQFINTTSHPASRASLNSSMQEGAERETLRKSCHFFEIAAGQISGLVTPVFCRQTGFYSARIIFCW